MRDMSTKEYDLIHSRFGLSITDAAPLMGISPRTLRALVTEGKIRSVRIGYRILLRPSDIESFMAAHSEGGFDQ